MSSPSVSPLPRPSAALLAAIALIAVSCGSGDGASDAPSSESTSNTEPAATDPPSTDPPSTDPPVTDPPVTDPPVTDPPASGPAPTDSPLPIELPPAVEALGYQVSNDYVVETVIADLPAATGGLTLDADGNMYTGDFGGFDDGPGNRILKITPDLQVEELVLSDDMGKNTSTVFGPDGTLYQSSFGTGRVFALSPEGALTTLAEGLSGPTGIVVRDDGSLLVQGYLGNEIYEVLPDGTVNDWSDGPGLNGPNGMVTGPAGEIYAVNHRNGAIFTFDDDGTAVELHRFPEETAHVAYLDGGLFVTSRANVVLRYDLATSEVVIIAGNGEDGDTDGRGIEASFGRPNAITVGPDGSLYMNHGSGDTYLPATIRRITYQPS